MDNLKKEWEAREKASLVALERDLRETHESETLSHGHDASSDTKTHSESRKRLKETIDR